MTSGRSFDAADGARMDETVRYILLNSMIFLGGSLLVLFGIQSLLGGLQVQGLRRPRVRDGRLPRVRRPAHQGPIRYLRAHDGRSLHVPLRLPRAVGRRPGLGRPVVVLIPADGDLPSRDGPRHDPVDRPSLLDRRRPVRPRPRGHELRAGFRRANVGVYILVLICTIVYEQTKIAKDLRVAQLTGALKVERDEIAVMKDNLRDGSS
jgi:hypothetical protein